MNSEFIKEYSQSILKYKSNRYNKGIFTLVLSLLTIFLLSFFNNGLKESINKQVFERGDSFRFSMLKNLTPNHNDTLSIIKTIAPNIEEAQALKKYATSLKVGYDISYFFPTRVNIKIDSVVQNINFVGIEEFPKSLLIKGRIHTQIDNEVIVNQAFFTAYQNNISNISIDISKQIRNVVDGNYFEDDFFYQKKLHVVGVIKEYHFMNEPTIYYRYQNMVEYLKNHYLYHYSLYFSRVITWYDYLVDSQPDSIIRGYSLNLFVNNIQDALSLVRIFANLQSKVYILESQTLTIYEVLQDLTLVVKSLLGIVIPLCTIILIFVMIYLIYISLMQDQHQIGITFSLGASKNNIVYSYIALSFNMVKKSLIISIPSSIVLAVLLNKIFDIKLGLVNAFSFVDSSYLFLITLCILLVIMVIITSLISIKILNKETYTLLKEE